MNEQLILQKLENIEQNMVTKSEFNELKADVEILKTDVSGLKTDVSGLKTDIHSLKHGFEHLLRNQNDIIEILGEVKDNMITKADLVSRPFWRSIL